MWDVFISHSSEDKDFVRQLAQALEKQGLSVWFDEMTLKLGDRLGQSIDEGLANSRFGVVVLSKSFFAKSWTRYELEGLVNKEIATGKTILPIWHGVTEREVAQHSPTLANKMAISTSMGLMTVVQAIMEVVRPSKSTSNIPYSQIVESTSLPESRSQGATSLSRLRDLLTTYFSESELRDLCFDLDIDYDNLPGYVKKDKARELIQYSQRRGRLPELTRQISQLRPHVSW